MVLRQRCSLKAVDAAAEPIDLYVVVVIQLCNFEFVYDKC